MDFTEAATKNGKVLRKDKDEAAVDATPASDHTVTRCLYAEHKDKRKKQGNNPHECQSQAMETSNGKAL